MNPSLSLLLLVGGSLGPLCFVVLLGALAAEENFFSVFMAWALFQALVVAGGGWVLFVCIEEIWTGGERRTAAGILLGVAPTVATLVSWLLLP